MHAPSQLMAGTALFSFLDVGSSTFFQLLQLHRSCQLSTEASAVCSAGTLDVVAALFPGQCAQTQKPREFLVAPFVGFPASLVGTPPEGCLCHPLFQERPAQTAQLPAADAVLLHWP